MPISAEEILAVLASESGIDPARLTLDASLRDLDIGSIDVVSAVFELEDRFGIEIDTDKIDPEFTVGQFVAHVQGIAEAVKQP